jgi:hypothetical protein
VKPKPEETAKATGAALGQRLRRLAALIPAAALLAAEQAAAMPTALGEVARRAETIALVTCVASESTWDPDGAVIVTRVTLRSDRVFKGNAQHTLVVYTLGGQVGPSGMGASHAARFIEGERAVVFVRQSAHGAYHVLVNGAAGKLGLDEAGRLLGVAAGADLSTFAAWIEEANASP